MENWDLDDKYLIHCDKQSVVQMLNSSTYSCKIAWCSSEYWHWIIWSKIDELLPNSSLMSKIKGQIAFPGWNSINSGNLLQKAWTGFQQNYLSKSGKWKNYGCHDSVWRLKMTIRSTCFTKHFSLCGSRNFKFETMWQIIEIFIHILINFYRWNYGNNWKVEKRNVSEFHMEQILQHVEAIQYIHYCLRQKT